MENQNEDRSIMVNIGNYDGREPIEVVLRKGEAEKLPEPLPNLEPLKIRLKGAIETPANWLEKRASEHNPKTIYAVIDRDDLSIGLVADEDDERNKVVVNGKIELSDIFKRFRINETEGWKPQELGQFIRLNRSYFEDVKQAIELVSKLKKFKAKVNQRLEKSEDRNGSIGLVYQQEVESNLPTDFSLNIPIFKGGKKQRVEVEIDHYVSGVDCYLQLFSPEARDIVVSTSDDMIDKELERLKTACPDIVIVEGDLEENGALIE